MKFVPFILRNVFRNRRRAILTMFNIGVSVFLVCTLKTFLDTIESPVSVDAGKRLVTRHATSLRLALPIAYRDQLQRVDGVESVSTAQWFGGVYRDPGNFFAQFAVDADRLFDVYPEFHTDNARQKEAFMELRTSALAGTLLRDRFKWKVGDKVTLEGATFPVRVETTLVGFIHGGGSETNFYFRWDYLNQLCPLDSAQAFFIKTRSVGDLASVSQTVDTLFANSAAPTQTETESAFIVEALSIWDSARWVLISIATVVLLTVFVAASNSVMLSVQEREVEIALLRTLGFTARHILSMMIVEASLLSVAGGVLGAITCRVVYSMIDFSSLSSGLIYRFDVRWITISLAVLSSWLVGIFSTVVPAYVVSTRPIVRGLRRS